MLVLGMEIMIKLPIKKLSKLQNTYCRTVAKYLTMWCTKLNSIKVVEFGNKVAIHIFATDREEFIG